MSISLVSSVVSVVAALAAPLDSGRPAAPQTGIVLVQQKASDAKALRGALERAYRALITAASSGELASLRNAISARAYKEAEENLADSGSKFTPEMVRAFTEDFPNLAALRLLDIKQVGDAASVLYVGDAEMDPGGEPRVLFVYLKFVREGGAWKYDGLVDVDDAKRQPDGSETRFDMEDVPPELRL